MQNFLHEFGKSRDDLTSTFYAFSDLESQLVSNWLRLLSPFSFEEPDVSNLLEEFADAIIDNKMVYNSLTAIEGLNAASLPFSLEAGIEIRGITEDELFEFGDLDRYRFISSRFCSDPIPSETWKMLDIKIQCDVPGVFSGREATTVRDAVIMSLRLRSSGSLQIIEKGTRGNYYDIGTRGSIKVSRDLIGRCERNYALSTEMIKRHQDSWPNLRMILESDSHHLRLPAQRLMDES